MKNGYIDSKDQRDTDIDGGGELVEDDRITAVGKVDPRLVKPDAEVIDLQGKYVLPGFVNTHVHTSQQISRGVGDDVDFICWLHDRMWPFESSMTEEAIKEGFRALKDGREYDLLYTSAKCRSEADWLVGMNATRAYTLQYHALLSIGRVQTPTLALNVERQKEIDAFTAEDYFEVQADFGGYTGLWIDREEHTRIDREDAAQAILAKTNGKPATITKVEKEEKKTPPPLLYDLTELQRECNKKFGFSAKKTLDIAQSLYEKRKMITYPRTDSRYLSEDMKEKVKSTIHRLQALEEYAPYVEPLMQEIRFTKRIIDNAKVTDHHAIIPTDGKLRPESLSEDEEKVFSLVAARFLAVFYPYYRYEVTKVYAEAEQERFLSKGTVVLEEGWQAVE